MSINRPRTSFYMSTGTACEGNCTSTELWFTHWAGKFWGQLAFYYANTKSPLCTVTCVAVSACIQQKPYLGYSSQLLIPMWQNRGLPFAVLAHKNLPHNPLQLFTWGTDAKHLTQDPRAYWWLSHRMRGVSVPKGPPVNLTQSHWIMNEQTRSWHSYLLEGDIYQWCWQLWSSF